MHILDGIKIIYTSIFLNQFGTKMTVDEAKQRVRKCFHEADLFKVNANLRTKGEAETSRVCSGLFSLLLIIFFAYIFIKEIVKLVNYETITSEQIFQTVDFESPAASNIKMSIKPSYETYSSWYNNFDVSAYIISEPAADVNGNKAPGTNSSLDLEICTQAMWENHTQVYSGFQLGQNLCIKHPNLVRINSSNWLDKINYLLVEIKKCNNQTNKNCSNDTKFNQHLNELYKNGVNFGMFFMPDVSINMNNIDPIDEFIPLNHYFTFTNQTRMRVSVYLGMYSVQTETSFWPLVETMETKTGYFIAKSISESINLEIENAFVKKDVYGDIFVYMTNIRKRYVRRVGKFDEVISYAGGLFGILIGLFSYCISYFNKYSYELVVAETAFNNDDHGSKVREKEFHFFKYIKYQFFSWVKLMFCCELGWADCKKIEESRNQANMYMEITSLFRRVQLFELLLSYIVDPDKYMLIQLTEPQSIEKIKEKRLMIQYYQTVITEDIAIKMDDVRSKNKSLQLYQKVEARRRSQNKQTEVIQEGEQKIEKKKNIMENMKKNLQIQDQAFLQEISDFPQIQERAKQVKLKEEMESVETIFAKAYLALDRQKKLEMIGKIPYKILHRLCMCARRLKENK